MLLESCEEIGRKILGVDQKNAPQSSQIEIIVIICPLSSRSVVELLLAFMWLGFDRDFIS